MAKTVNKIMSSHIRGLDFDFNDKPLEIFNSPSHCSHVMSSTVSQLDLQSKVQPWMKQLFTELGADNKASNWLVDLFPVVKKDTRFQVAKEGQTKICCPICRDGYSVNILTSLVQHFPKTGTGNNRMYSWSDDYKFWYPEGLTIPEVKQMGHFFSSMYKHVQKIHQLEHNDDDMPYVL